MRVVTSVHPAVSYGRTGSEQAPLSLASIEARPCEVRAVSRTSSDSLPQLADQICAAKPVQWRGCGELLQLPWSVAVRGLFLVIDLWSGFGGLIYTLLSLGLRIIVVSAETDPVARAAASSVFPHVIHVDLVESLHVGLFLPFFKRRVVQGVIIGGGSPCQGNTFLNKHRKGLGDPRSLLPSELQRLLSEFTAHPLLAQVPVYAFLENVASMPRAVRMAYNEVMGCAPVEVQAGAFGYTQRRRFLWLNRMGFRPLSLPQLLQQSPHAVPDGVQVQFPTDGSPVLLIYTGRPIPLQVHWDGGFRPLFQPQLVVQQGGSGAMYTFTREFFHPTDQTHGVSAEAIQRFFEDARRFPPMAYEAESLLWKGQQWRQPYPHERAAMLGLPPDCLQSVTLANRDQTTAARNSLLGNGFHVPSIMLVFSIMLSSAASSIVPRPPRHVQWTQFCSRAHGSCFQPQWMDAWPDLSSVSNILDDMQLMLPGIGNDDIWAKAHCSLNKIRLQDLQVYQAFARFQTFEVGDQGPEWSGPRHRASVAAAMGKQRAAGNSLRGLDHMLMPGLGSQAHMAAAADVLSPFSALAPVDADVKFALYAMKVLGESLPVWRAHQAALFKEVAMALQPLVSSAHAGRSENAVKVNTRNPVYIAFATALLRWPDRQQALQYIKGFPIVGSVQSSGVFRPLPSGSAEWTVEDFLGESAAEAVSQQLAQPMPKAAQQIWELTEAEVSKGTLSTGVPASVMNARYGIGRWRPMPRFLITQSCGKSRAIDDARRGQHNEATDPSETIYTIDPDFIPSVLQHMVDVHVSQGAHWPDMEMSTDDLPDAYKSCPVVQEHQCVCVIAVWHVTLHIWVFCESWALAFGLASAVVAFNRFPTMMTAWLRRVFAVVSGAYFDDVLTIEPVCCQGNGQAVTKSQYSIYGAPPAPSKSFPLSHYRVYLGTVISLARFVDEAVVTLGPKSSTKAVIRDQLALAAVTPLKPGAAAKLRGQCGWAATNSAGRLGYIGLKILTDVQYGRIQGDHPDVLVALRFLSQLYAQLQVREVCVLRSLNIKPTLIYSDASWEPLKQPPGRVGWLIFQPGHQGRGATMVLSQQLIDSWKPRTQQIYPAEAIAPLIVFLTEGPSLAGQDIIWFIDNEAACASLIRGASTQHDVGTLMYATHILFAKYGCRVWFEWIDSHSNPSDGLSRDGLEDEWTRAQGWSLREVPVPPDALQPDILLKEYVGVLDL